MGREADIMGRCCHVVLKRFLSLGGVTPCCPPDSTQPEGDMARNEKRSREPKTIPQEHRYGRGW